MNTINEIPPTALREALINALIHRYCTNSGRDIKVGIYDDMVNIVSPGGFPNTITALDIQNGRSETRNKVIANVFKELGLIEQWGSGINRIKGSCEQNGLKTPKIEEQNDFVDVEIYRFGGTQKTTQKTTQKSSKDKILELLKANSKSTREELVKDIGISANAVKQHLSNLQKNGKLKPKLCNRKRKLALIFAFMGLLKKISPTNKVS